MNKINTIGGDVKTETLKIHADTNRDHVCTKTTIQDLYDGLRVMSYSEFAVAASGEHGEDLLAAIVGACGRAIDVLDAAREYIATVEAEGVLIPKRDALADLDGLLAKARGAASQCVTQTLISGLPNCHVKGSALQT